MSTHAQPKVFVGLSGGVDSAVSLALLKKATPNNFEKLFGRPTPEGFRGYDVSGVYIKSWVPDWVNCDWKEDRRDAMRVCAHLSVPFYELDLSDLYKREVIDHMIAEYRAGRTPNPDVVCNRAVKFGAFWEWAKQNGADAIATGHYAQILLCHSRGGGNPAECRFRPVESNTLLDTRLHGYDNSFQLLRGPDPTKDQSYFLWTLNQNDLAHVMFPIGHLKKTEVRALAQKFKLPVAEKKDSQGICLLGNIDLQEFLSHFIEQKTGDVVNEHGEVIGTHSGVTFFTIGERHGFTITKKTPIDGAYYIIAKDISKNTLTVSQHLSEAGLIEQASKIISLAQVNQIIPWEMNRVYDVQIRYHGTVHKATVLHIDTQKNTADISFESQAPLIASGQSVVVYSGTLCIGGGIRT